MSPRNSRAARRHHSRRRMLSDVGLIVSIVGVMCLLFGVLFALYSFMFSPGPKAHDRQFNLALIYAGTGALLLILRGLVALIRARIHRNQTRYPGARASAARRPAPPATVPSPARDASSGSVLVLTLIVLGLVAALILQSLLSARVSLRAAEQALAATRLELAAADATRQALQELANDEDLLVDHTNEPWASPRELAHPDGVSTRTVVSDENRYFDLNNLAVPVTGEPLRTAPGMLMDLFTLCGDFEPVQKVDAVRDWVDADTDGYYESAAYLEQALAYRPPNRPLAGWGELLLVSGLKREFFNRHDRRSLNEAFSANVVDNLTVLPVARNHVVPVNVNTASREVLLAILGAEREAMADTLVTRRLVTPFRSLDQLALLADPLLVDAVAPYLGVRSGFFRVATRAYLAGQALNLHALVQRDTKGTVSVLHWVY